MSSEKATSANDEDRVDGAIMELLLAPEDQRPWTIDDLTREVGSTIEVEDGISRLIRAGLAHRQNDLVVPSRAALRVVEVIPNELR